MCSAKQFINITFVILNCVNFLVRSCLAAVSEEEKSQWMATSYETLIQAKKENVALQLEAAYRERLQDAYQQVSGRGGILNRKKS